MWFDQDWWTNDPQALFRLRFKCCKIPIGALKHTTSLFSSRAPPTSNWWEEHKCRDLSCEITQKIKFSCRFSVCCRLHEACNNLLTSSHWTIFSSFTFSLLTSPQGHWFFLLLLYFLWPFYIMSHLILFPNTSYVSSHAPPSTLRQSKAWRCFVLVQKLNQRSALAANTAVWIFPTVADL